MTAADRARSLGRPFLRHDAIFYADEAFLFTAATEFVRAGVERGEMVLVNTGAHRVTTHLRGIFADADQVVFSDVHVYDTPATALDGYRRVMDAGRASGVAGFRAMGHIDFGSSHLPWQEWLRYEAAVNRVFADYPFRTLCPYDTSAVDAGVVSALRRAHPGLVEPDGWRANEEYADPVELVLEGGLRTPRHPLQDTDPRIVLEPGGDLEGLRLEVYAATLFTDLPRRKLDDFVSAVGEVVRNALRHGAPPVELRLWAEGEGVLCTVTDAGPGIPDPLAGYARPTEATQGLGLWAARQLCDVLDYERGEHGFTVRVASFL